MQKRLRNNDIENVFYMKDSRSKKVTRGTSKEKINKVMVYENACKAQHLG